MNTDLGHLLADQPLIAVVGATDDPSKFGGRIYRYLKQRGYSVVAVNRNRSEVDRDPAYPNLASLPVQPDIISLVVPASEGVDVVRQAGALNLDNVWVQPGAESPGLEVALRAEDLAYSLHDCIMTRA